MNVAEEWVRAMSTGWHAAEGGDYAMAKRCYVYADNVALGLNDSDTLAINPDLSVLRHKVGAATGIINSVPPTEDIVVSVEFGRTIQEEESATNLRRLNLNDINLDSFDFKIDQHLIDNTTKELPHVMFLSTGRCGTVSMFHLFETLNYTPYHSYYYHVSQMDRMEMMCRVDSGDYDSKIPNNWLKTRVAEWVGANNVNKPMVALNHMDTIFAPVFAKMHPKSKFVHLRRDPLKVFKSMYSKGQWSDKQLHPIYYSLSDGFKYRYMRYDMPITIAWYIKFTETFSRAFGATMGDRYIEISSDKLFTQDANEISRLSNFLETRIDKDHFKIPYNQKAHKVSLSKDQIQAGAEAFEVAYAAL